MMLILRFQNFVCGGQLSQNLPTKVALVVLYHPKFPKSATHVITGSWLMLSKGVQAEAFVFWGRRVTVIASYHISEKLHTLPSCGVQRHAQFRV